MAMKKPLFLPLLAFITTSLLLLRKVASVETVQFNFPKFDEASKKDLIFQGDATVVSSENILRLTKVDSNGNPAKHSVGRVLYSKPIHLWSSSGSWAADFTTSFTFRITSPGGPADGVAFFIASQDTTIPPNSDGGFLGLFSNANANGRNNTRNEVVRLKAAKDKVVAVEFDTYYNPNYGDPNHKHVGVDVNSIRSRATKEWTWVSGDPVSVSINYNPYGKELRIVASDYSGPRVELVYNNLDLKAELPEHVRVGLTASTGENVEINDFLNWSFHSNLDAAAEEEEGYIASVV